MQYVLLSDVGSFSNERISIEHVTVDNYISTENMVSDKGGVVQASALPDAKKVAKYNPEDILLSNIRPYFKKIWFANRTGGCSNDVLVVHPNKGIDAKFLYYVLSDNNFFNYDTLTAKGTKMPRGTKHAILRYWIPNIPLQDQQKIASILSAYDSLIEHNKKRIKLLEQMAENLYKEWFVRFRFPGYETAEFEGGVPKGWRIEKLGNVANIRTGKCNREDAEEGGIFPLFDRSQEIKKSNTWLMDCEAIIVPGEGTSFTPRYYEGKFNLHQRCYCVEPRQKGTGKFLFYMLMFNKAYFLSVATGATVSSLRQNNFTKMKFIMPSFDLCRQYDKHITLFFTEIDTLSKQVETLTTQRDLLLPRLMSGKLSI